MQLKLPGSIRSQMEYVDVSNPTELCEKCHVTTTGNAFGSAVDHKITLGGSAHLNYGGFIGEEAPPSVLHRLP